MTPGLTSWLCHTVFMERAWKINWMLFFFPRRIMCSIKNKKSSTLQNFCCTSSYNSMYSIASLNNFCTFLKLIGSFQKLTSAWSFATNHILPTCSTFWCIKCNVYEDHLYWELRFVARDQFSVWLGFFLKILSFIKIMFFRVFLYSLLMICSYHNVTFVCYWGFLVLSENPVGLFNQVRVT